MSSAKMASSKRKQDEKHLRMLREMAALPHNKHCFDCHQRGPTYVNMTIGSFVCTSCSGILRGINPPHRVKSISMASFTPDEMDFLKLHGNDFCRKVYLGLYDSRSGPEPDAREEQKVKDFMIQKYEKKRFYVAPTEAMKEEARQMNEAATNKEPQTKPLKNLLGNNATPLVVQSSQTPKQSPASTPGSIGPPASAAAKQDMSFQSPGQQSQSSQSSGSATMDLLGDLGGDPFGSSAPAAAAPASSAAFADFSAFNSHFSAPAPPHPSQPNLFQTNSNTLTPLADMTPLQAPNAPKSNTMPASQTAAPVAPPSTLSGADKYASLGDLFSTPTPEQSSSTPSGMGVNWSGGAGDFSSAPSSASTGGINWGGPTNTATTGISWDGSGVKNVPASNAAGGSSGSSLNWNGAPSSASSNMFPASTGANPFGGSSSSIPSQAPSSNPFGAGSGGQSLFGAQPTSSTGGFGAPASMGGFSQPSSQNSMGNFGMSTSQATSGGFGPQGPTAGGFGQQVPASGGFGQQPVSMAGGFGQGAHAMGGFGQPQSTMGAFGQFGTTQQPVNSFAQFGMQNGGVFSSASSQMPTTGAGFGGTQQASSGFGTAGMGMMGPQPTPSGGFPAMTSQAGWGQPVQTPSANPFMSAASQQIAPKSSSNPFL